jgi:hypothetical protein
MFEPAPATAGTRRRLFLHCVRSPERALVLAQGDDIVCVPGRVEPEYLGFLSSLGIGPSTDNVIMVPPAVGHAAAGLCERLLASPATIERIAARLGPAPVLILPHAGTAEVFAVAEALGAGPGGRVRVHAPRPRLTALLERKDFVRQRARELGIPVADGELAELASPYGRRRRDLEPLRLAIERQLRPTGRVLLRGSGGGGGSARYVVGLGGEHTDDVIRQIALRSGHRAWLVDVLVDASVCSTVHVEVDPAAGTVRMVGISDRRLGRALSPVGDRFPTAATTAVQMEHWALAFGEWLRGAGYVGLVGFDFVEHRDPGTGRADLFLAGVETRAREAAYLMAMRGRLGAGAFVSGGVTTRLRGFARVREALGGLLYDPDRTTGIIPYAAGCPEQGRCPVVAFGVDRQQASELLGRAQAALSARLTSPPDGR